MIYDVDTTVIVDSGESSLSYLASKYGEDFFSDNLFMFSENTKYENLDEHINNSIANRQDVVIMIECDGCDTYKRELRTNLIYNLKHYETLHNVTMFKKCLLFVYSDDGMTEEWQYKSMNNFETPWYTEGWNKIEIERVYFDELSVQAIYNVDFLIKECNEIYPSDETYEFSLGEHLHRCAVAGNSGNNPSIAMPLLLHDISKRHQYLVHYDDCNYENISAYESLFYFVDGGNNTTSLYVALMIEFLPKFRALEENGFDVSNFVTSTFYKDLIEMEKIEKICK